MARRALMLMLKGDGFVWAQRTTHYSVAVLTDFPQYSLFAEGVLTMLQMHPLQFYTRSYVNLLQHTARQHVEAT